MNLLLVNINMSNINTMIMKKLLFLLFISCSIHAIAQTDYYYYYGNNKMPLTLNENKICVCIPKEYKAVNERILANVRLLATINDNAFEIFVIKQSDYEKLTSLDSWEEDAKYVILTSVFLTEKNEELFSTPYLNVRLKKEDDVDLLTAYVERYKLKIVRNMLSMPLWYILSVTLESEKSPLECANELYESGNFAVSEPDMAGSAVLDYSAAVRGITKPNSQNTLYDLQGRRLMVKPAKGVYIENGRKRMVK